MMKSIVIQYKPGTEDLYGKRLTVQEWACNKYGEGIFFRKDDGTWQQYTGTGQTPVFRTPEELRRYLRTHYEVRSARIIETMGWGA